MTNITHEDELVTKSDLQEFYNSILPYLGSMPEALVTKFNKSDIYSNDEKIVGCWTDGRPIYQKLINFTVPSTTEEGAEGSVYVSVGASVSNFIDIDAKFINSSTNSEMFVPKYAFTSTDVKATTTAVHHHFIQGVEIIGCPNAHTSSTVAHPNTFFVRNTNPSYNGYAGIAILKYTKTTDAANSFVCGDENDYSFDEKIVGTWIDGKPIYQKTIYTIFTETVTDGVTTHHDVSITDLDIDKVIDLDTMICFPGSRGWHKLNIAYSINGNWFYTRCYIYNNNLTIESNRAVTTGADLYVTIRYTKV